MTERKMYFFGCWYGKGHHMFTTDGRYRSTNMLASNEIARRLDGGFCPRTDEYQAQGQAALTHIDGWTVLAFWDRTIDTRYNSNAALLMEGTHTWDEMIATGRATLPKLFARWDAAFTIRPSEVSDVAQDS